MQITVELGIGGALCFLCVLFFLLRAAFSLFLCARDSASVIAVVGGISAIVGVLVMGLFDYVWYHQGIFWLFWVTVASILGAMQARLDGEERCMFRETVWR